MLFDIIKSKNSRLAGYDSLYNHCIDCEKTVRTRPYNIKTRARTSLEKFLNAVLDINGVKIPESMDERKAKKLNTIQEKIDYCIDNGFIPKSFARDLHFIRKAGNEMTHSGDGFEGASKVLKALYRVIASYATKTNIKTISPLEKIEGFTAKNGNKVKGKDGYETEDLLPIGEYEVIKPMFATNAPKDKIKAYKCKRTTVFENKSDVQYAIIKRFLKNEPNDVTQFRDHMAMNAIKKHYAILDKPPILSEEIETADDCKYRYLCYLTSENTFILNQKNTFSKYLETKKDKSQSEQLLIRLNILKDILEILNSLINITENISIHHRNLRPDCVFLTPTFKGLSVSVGNFEYSKITDLSAEDENGPTININAYSEKVQDDPYAPSEIKSATIKKMGNPDWEQVDVYACAKISLYILFGDANNENTEKYLEYINKNLSFDFYTITKNILENPYPTRPSIKEYLKAVRKEILINE